MNKIFLLKIEKGNDLLLSTIDAKQEIFPLEKFVCQKNLDGVPINQTNFQDKLKCSIETYSSPNLNNLQLGASYKIYSILEFSNNQDNFGRFEPIEDSIRTDNQVSYFRPILNMILTNFSGKTDSDLKTKWKFDFEET